MITDYRALSLAAAALADCRRVLQPQNPDFASELHEARDYVLNLRARAAAPVEAAQDYSQAEAPTLNPQP